MLGLAARYPARPIAAAALLAVLALLLAAGQAPPAQAEGGGRVEYSDATPVHDAPFELLIAYFTDCSEVPNFAPPRCGSPPAKWAASSNPVPICTAQANRPDWLGAHAFREAVAQGARAWNNAASAAVGVRYTGDCPGDRWEEGNGLNEIGFDDGRNVVDGPDVALTSATWRSVYADPTRRMVIERTFIESDIVLDPDRVSAGACFASTVTHEFGHLLGLGHSNEPRDLMYPSYKPGRPAGCLLQPSPAEVALLRSLYGSDTAPLVSAGLDLTVGLFEPVVLTAEASDPDGGDLSYEWVQTGGPPLWLGTRQAQPELSFRAPAEPAVLVFEVTATDRYLHQATDRVAVTVTRSGAPPQRFPVFESFLAARYVPDAPEGTAVLGWSDVEDATAYEFCWSPAEALFARLCNAALSSPSIPVTWDRIFDEAGRADATVLLNGGWRATSIRACNAGGCSRVSEGPLAGGVRWDAWDIDYDVIVIIFDISGVQFTFAGAVNLAGTGRKFVFGNGPPDDPFQTTMGACRSLGRNGFCFGYLDYQVRDQGAVVGIRSTRPGTPTIEHHVPVR